MENFFTLVLTYELHPLVAIPVLAVMIFGAAMFIREVFVIEPVRHTWAPPTGAPDLTIPPPEKVY